MSTATSSLNSDMSNTTNFQAMMGTFLDANIQSFGWVYTAQSGDVDPSAASAPSGGSYAGFRVYASGDALTTFYLRIDFGRRSATSAPMIKFQVGSGVNGSGTLTGQTSTAQEIACSQVAGSYQSYMSGDGGRLCVLLNAGSATSALVTNCMVFAIGRTLDTSGVASATGIELFHNNTPAGGQSSTYQQYVPFSGTVPVVETWWTAVHTLISPATIGTSQMFGIPQTFGAAGGNNPQMLVGIHDASTLTSGTLVSLTLYGASRNYLVTQLDNCFAAKIQHRVMMRYD